MGTTIRSFWAGGKCGLSDRRVRRGEEQAEGECPRGTHLQTRQWGRDAREHDRQHRDPAGSFAQRLPVQRRQDWVGLQPAGGERGVAVRPELLLMGLSGPSFLMRLDALVWLELAVRLLR
jgi:hypothetical protein